MRPINQSHRADTSGRAAVHALVHTWINAGGESGWNCGCGQFSAEFVKNLVKWHVSRYVFTVTEYMKHPAYAGCLKRRQNEARCDKWGIIMHEKMGKKLMVKKKKNVSCWQISDEIACGSALMYVRVPMPVASACDVIDWSRRLRDLSY